MLKRIIPIVLLLCLIFSTSVMAENTNAVSDETTPEVSQQMPQDAGESPRGGRGEMGMPPMGDMQNRGTPPSTPNGEAPPEGMNRGQRPAGELNTSQNGEISNNEEATVQHTDSNTAEENSQMPDGNPQFGGQMPGGMDGFTGNMQNNNQNTQTEQKTTFLGFVKTNSTPITSVILLILAFIFIIFYRRKNY